MQIMGCLTPRCKWCTFRDILTRLLAGKDIANLVAVLKLDGTAHARA